MGSKYIPVEPLEGEEWRDTVGLPNYRVSSFGRVSRKAGTFRAPFERILEGGTKTTGYRQVVVRTPNGYKSFPVHQLVADAFLRVRVPGDVVNHLDGNKTNNHVTNLEITDRAGNIAHAMKHGLLRSGIRHGMAKLTDANVREIRARFAAGEQGQAIAQAFNINRNYAYQIKRGEERAAS